MQWDFGKAAYLYISRPSLTLTNHWVLGPNYRQTTHAAVPMGKGSGFAYKSLHAERMKAGGIDGNRKRKRERGYSEFQRVDQDPSAEYDIEIGQGPCFLNISCERGQRNIEYSRKIL